MAIFTLVLYRTWIVKHSGAANVEGYYAATFPSSQLRLKTISSFKVDRQILFAASKSTIPER